MYSYFGNEKSENSDQNTTFSMSYILKKKKSRQLNKWIKGEGMKDLICWAPFLDFVLEVLLADYFQIDLQKKMCFGSIFPAYNLN